jgi:hypothetical protein
MEKISCTDCVINEEALHRVRGERNILPEMKRWEWIGHNLLRNCVLNYFVEGKIEGRDDKKENVNSY